MKPKLCYTIWFSQRTGSSLLYKALESTQLAGAPREWLHNMDPQTTGMTEIRQMWKDGTSMNGVFGLKYSVQQSHLDQWLSVFNKEFELAEGLSRPRLWDAAFPACKHIYMTRRNKVRLAVSWWRAIVSGEWHRVHGEKPSGQDISDEYSFDAINHLLMESNMREAAVEAFYSEEGIIPLTIVYEDFIQNYEGTVLTVLKYLGIPTDTVRVAPPYLDQISDDVAEQWVQRYREECQAGWENRAW